jgi:hypothetical protein
MSRAPNSMEREEWGSGALDGARARALFIAGGGA